MGIIVSMVYLVYAYFSKNVSEYSIMSAENFEIQSFYTLLKEDFYNCDKIVTLNESSFTVIFYNEQSIKYSKKGDFLFRQNKMQKDSIPLTKLEIEYLSPIEDPTQGFLVSSVSLYSLLFKEQIPFYVYKNYYSNYKNIEQ